MGQRENGARGRTLLKLSGLDDQHSETRIGFERFDHAAVASKWRSRSAAGLSGAIARPALGLGGHSRKSMLRLFRSSMSDGTSPRASILRKTA